MATSTAQNTSTSSVLTSLVVNLIIFGCFVGAFLVLRLRFKRIYSPKSAYDLVPPDQRPQPLPKDPVRWIFILLTKPHSFILQQCGLDGYFFIRFLYVFGITFLCAILTWIVLFPINAVGGKGSTGLDQLSISNIAHPKRYYAHAVMAWMFYGSVVYVIYRELFFFNSLRLAVLSSPRYAARLASRTVLFQSVPDHWLDEKQFFKLFNGVKRIYVTRNVRRLDAKNRKRENTALLLERATTKLIKKGMKAMKKAQKKNVEVDNPGDINSWVPADKRPRMKLGGFFSKKIDTIEHCREELPKLNAEVRHLQKRFRHAHPKNSIFVEFDSQYSAQIAYQSVVNHTPMRASPAFIGFAPEDIDWGNMRLFWWERIVRSAIAMAAIIALIIFWAIPVAFVGVISNIDLLTQKLPWLDFINNLPKWILGVVTGLLPTVMLAVLTAVLPMFIRAMAKVAGCISTQEVEKFTHKAYFAFLTVNGFLVTALASSAAATVQQIIDKPSSALSVLAKNLPKSSNFYVSYLILQGLTVSGGALFQVVGLFLYYILGSIFDGTLRKKWARFSGLSTISWGTTFPIFANLASITLAFAIIAPMIFLFASVAFLLMLIAYSHNLTYVFAESADSRGVHYPMALKNLFTGIYIGQIGLLGLFIIGKGWGPIVLQAILLGFTIFAHVHIDQAFGRLLDVIPIDCMKPLDGVSQTVSCKEPSEYRTKVLDRKHNIKSTDALVEEHEEHKEVVRDLEESVAYGDSLVPVLADRDFKTTDSKNPIIRYLRPDVYLNFRHAKRMMPAMYNIAEEEPDNKHAFDQPVISAQMPTLWIPKDPMGWSTQEIELNKGVVEMTDASSGFNNKGKMVITGKPPIE